MAYQNNPPPRIALVYDWLDTGVGGAEQVLRALHELYPQAPLYTAYITPQAPNWTQDMEIKTSFLQKHSWLWRRKSVLASFMPFAFESFDLSPYDIVISISSFAAKGVLTKPHQLHVCYLLTPTRFLHSHTDTYLATGIFKYFPFKNLAARQLKKIKRWDQVAAHRPDYLIPISHLVSQRIKKYYQRAALPPIYPPVDLRTLRTIARDNFAQKYQPSNFPLEPTKKFDLIVARLVKYKRVDLAIQMAVKQKRFLVIAGHGPYRSQLQKLALELDPERQFHYFAGQTSLQDLVYFYQHAQLFIMPGEEDFGITGLEAQSFGVPILVNGQSGVAELIQDQMNGFHLSSESISALERGFSWYEINQIPLRKSKLFIAKNTIEYDTSQFKKHFSQRIQQLWQQLSSS